MADQIPMSLFEQIFRRAPTESERQRLLRIKSALGLSERDELWPIIITMELYAGANLHARRDIVKAVNGLPGTIKKTVTSIEAHAQTKIDAATTQAIELGTEKLRQVIVQRSRASEDHITRQQMSIAATIGAVVALLCLCVGAGAGYLLAKSINDICTTEAFAVNDGRQGCYVD
jgi:hypothetical protein